MPYVRKIIWQLLIVFSRFRVRYNGISPLHGTLCSRQVRIDHNKASLTFGTDLGVAQKEDTPEGPFIQSMPSEQIRSQLAHMANALNQAVKIVRPVDDKRDDMRAHICQSYRQVQRKEHQRILQRRQIIEDRKEELENLNNARVRHHTVA